MNRREPPASATASEGGAVPQTIHIHNHPPRSSWIMRILVVLLVISAGVNIAQMVSFRDYAQSGRPPYERFEQGDLESRDKIAILEITGTILPPFSDRTLKTIEQISQDEQVRGVVVAIDSPGGLVADSHRIYLALKELSEKKQMVVSLGRIAASGGYYVAMGAGPKSPIFAEEITWTGSIGVIIPRYDLSQLGEKVGVHPDSLKTGELKGSLDPLAPLSETEREVWRVILDESLAEFVSVIDAGRAGLSEPEIRKLATGQIYTARQALELNLVDRIGDRDDALAALQKSLGLESVRVVRYDYPGGLLETVLGVSARQPQDPLQTILDASVPRAMYLFGWESAAGRHLSTLP